MSACGTEQTHLLFLSFSPLSSFDSSHSLRGAKGEETDLPLADEKPLLPLWWGTSEACAPCFMKGKSGPPPPPPELCFHLSLTASPWSLCAHSPALSHICTAHARLCAHCTQAGFALIPDCLWFLRWLDQVTVQTVCRARQERPSQPSLCVEV